MKAELSWDVMNQGSQGQLPPAVITTSQSQRSDSHTGTRKKKVLSQDNFASYGKLKLLVQNFRKRRLIILLLLLLLLLLLISLSVSLPTPTHRGTRGLFRTSPTPLYSVWHTFRIYSWGYTCKGGLINLLYLLTLKEKESWISNEWVKTLFHFYDHTVFSIYVQGKMCC